MIFRQSGGIETEIWDGSGGGRLQIHSISGRRSGGYKCACQVGGSGPAALNSIVIDCQSYSGRSVRFLDNQ